MIRAALKPHGLPERKFHVVCELCRSLFHDIDATIMILMWNLGAAALIVGLGRIFGRRMLSWVAPQPLDRPL